MRTSRSGGSCLFFIQNLIMARTGAIFVPTVGNYIRAFWIFSVFLIELTSHPNVQIEDLF
jgi:hypothetical protein